MTIQNSFRRQKEIAKELNDVLILNPPIDYVRTTPAKLEQEIKQAAEMIQPGMQFNEDTLEYLFEINAEIGKKTRDYVEIDEKEKKKRKIYDCFGKDYERKSNICQECLRKEFCRSKFVQALSLLQHAQKTGMYKIEIDDITYEYTKEQALIQALRIGGSKKEIIEMANELYMQKDRPDCTKMLKRIFPLTVRILGYVRLLRVHNDFYLLRDL